MFRFPDIACGHKTKSITTIEHGRCSVIYTARVGEGYCQFTIGAVSKGNSWTTDRLGGVHMDFPECVDQYYTITM